MKKLFFLLLISYSFISNLYSQDTYQLKEAWDFFRSHQLQTGDWRTDLTNENIQGSPYLNSDFINGIIFTSSKFQYIDVPLRYNIFNDELEFKTAENEIQAIASPEIIERVEFGNYKLVYTSYSHLDKRDQGFLQLLINGNASLYVKSEVIFQEPTEAAAYKEPGPAKYINKSDSYYIKVGNEIPQKVRGKKEIIELFQKHENEIAHFIKENKIKLRNSESLKELVKYYNTL